VRERGKSGGVRKFDAHICRTKQEKRGEGEKRFCLGKGRRGGKRQQNQIN